MELDNDIYNKVINDYMAVYLKYEETIIIIDELLYMASYI